MKKLVLVVLLLSAFSFAANKPAPNPADYNVNVHVSASSIEDPVQFLNVVIDGKNYELRGERAVASSKDWAILALGDYKAKLVTDVHDTTYESTQEL